MALQRLLTISVLVGSTAVLGGAVIAQQDDGLPVVTRKAPATDNPLDRASLVVLLRVVKTSLEESPNDDPGSQYLPGRRRLSRSAEGTVVDVVRVNERRADEPTLERRSISVVQIDPRDQVQLLEVSQLYLVPLSTTEDLLRYWRLDAEACPIKLAIPGYVLASPQVGYQLTGGASTIDTTGRRLRVLKRGGPLDQYDGLLFDDVAKKLKNWAGYR